jgi:WD40 repeat protein
VQRKGLCWKTAFESTRNLLLSPWIKLQNTGDIKEAHTAAVMCVQIVPGKNAVFSCGNDGKLRRWDMDTKQEVRSFRSFNFILKK